MNVAVIIPYKNAEAWLPRCLMSCLKADGRLRFLLINDRSSDTSEDIAMSYALQYERFEAYDNEHKPGVSGARNTGLDHLNGAEWFTFLDADDVLNESAYYEIKKEAEKTEADIIQFNHLRQYAEALPIMKHYEPAGWRPLTALPSCWVPVWNKAYRTETLQYIRFVEGMQFGEDELYNIHALKIARGIKCAEGTTITRRFPNPESLSKSVQPRDLEIEVEVLLTWAGVYGIQGDKEMHNVIEQRLDTLRTLPRYNGIFRKEANT